MATEASITDLLRNPGIQQSILSRLLELLLGYLARPPQPVAPPPVLVTVPTPKPVQVDPAFPDDIIPPPAPTRKVVRVTIKLARGEYNAERVEKNPGAFPNARPGPNGRVIGIVDPVYWREIVDGTSALPWGSKFWLDLTAYDAAGNEFLRDAVLSHGLAFQTEHHAGAAFIIGHGLAPGPEGGPQAGYETNDTDAIGNGNAAWVSSLGFLHQMKAHGQGTFDLWGKVAGVESNRLTLHVS